MSDTPRFRIALVCLCLFAICITGNSQSLKDLIQKGDRFYYKKDYKKALVHYEQALRVDPSDAQTNFKAGVCLLEERNYSDAVTHLERAYQTKPDVDLDIDYHLGVAYQGNHQYAQARKHFESLLTGNKRLAPLANQKITQCAIGDSLMRIPSNARVTPVGDMTNTSFSEFSPLLLDGGNTLIFTSNRSTDDYQIKSRTNTADVYITSRKGNTWGVPQKISENINVKTNEVATSVSADGKTLFLYYEDGGGDIYTSTHTDGQWLPPAALNRFVNHPQYRESSACVSADGKRLYFSSNRPGGKGGFDIYVCEMGANGQWGRPANLGSRINTRGDEETPYLAPDGTTLYFSSDGHASLGGKDIFKSSLINGHWTPPENLGYPINTSGHEAFFVLSDDQTAYFSSARTSDETNTDLYQVSYAAMSAPGGERADARATKGAPLLSEGIVTVLKGTVIDAGDATPLQAVISLIDNSSKDVLTTVHTDRSGNFKLVIPYAGNFGVTTKRNGYLFNSLNFNLPSFKKYQEIDTHIPMVKAKVGSKIVLKNVFFDFNESTLKKESLSELENIHELLAKNPGWRIQVNGHTDNTGQPEANLALSLKRAESVVRYLVEHGISPDLLQAKGFGSEHPLVSNDDEREGRQINRRTEIEIIE